MNKKGFAISTVIYGLSIMGVLIFSILMGIMSTTRANNREFSKIVEDELNRFSRTEVNLAPSGSNTQIYTVPQGESGWYRIELWGAQGGPNGGLGAYTSGIIELKEGDELNIYVGKHPTSTASGEETDVRINSGSYQSSSSYNTRIMVAAGGGSSSGASGGTIYGYSNQMTPTGGRINSIVTQTSAGDFKLASGSNLIGSPTGYANSGLTYNSSAAKPHQSGTGGDGYVPSSNANIGGVSFIAGYAMPNTTAAPVTVSGKKYFFYDGKMIPGVNPGNGKARISRVAKKTDDMPNLPRKNTKLGKIAKNPTDSEIKVTQIRDCLATTNTNRSWAKIKAIKDGYEVALSGMATTTKSGYECRVVSFSPTVLDEIAVWHKENTDYQNHTIEVYNNNGWQYVKAPTSGGETTLSETETVNGVRISAYQPDYTTTLPENGNYYIVPVLTENKVLSARKAASDDLNILKVENLVGEKRQIWSIEKVVEEKIRKNDYATNPEYKIIELARFKALEIHLDENKLGNGVYAPEVFNYNARNEIAIWKFTPLGNGTYKIQTVMEIFDTSNPTGNLCPNTSAPTAADKDSVVISPNRNPNDTQRFKLISLD